MGIELKTYSDILSELDNNGETHLLLGNDFNLSIGIDTSYNDIFNKMKERYKGYKDLTIEGDNYDIEKIIGKLKNQLKDSDCKPFLEKFINDRIKLEFMNSAFTIVKDSLKNIHQEKNEGIKVLFKKFTNYFSLDYDPFLCLLLMKYKKPNTDKVIAFQNDTLFILNDTKNNIVKYILEIHANYTKKLGKERENDVVKPFSKLTKSALKQKIREDAKKDHKRISQEDINGAYEQIKSKNKKLKIEDGFRSELFLKKNFTQKRDKFQNTFFLHGVFHIYNERKAIYKITKTQNKALYERLEEILESEDKDIVSVFTHDNKKGEIDDNRYKKKGVKDLEALTGSIVIIGSSLDKNDQHIFESISSSKVNKICYASAENEQKKHKQRLEKLFPEKEIILFDKETISYEKTF